MRTALIALAAALSAPAHAAEVVWLSPPSDADAATVARLAGAARPPLSPLDLRAAPSAFGPSDTAAWEALDRTLAEVRAFETRLDGEALIARDLAPTIAAITLLRSPAERDRLRRALAYQGFAVHRLAAGDLSIDEVAPYVWTNERGALIRPWLDAIALDPSYAITAYDIAEAPQRVAYNETAETVRGLLPATVQVGALRPGVELWIDGVQPEIGPARTLRLPPGRHRAHLVEQGLVTDRWTLDLEPGGSAVIEPTLNLAAFNRALGELAAGPTPEILRPAIAALGGEVWIAEGSSGKVRAWRVTERQVTDADVRVSASKTDGETPRFSVAATVGAGWLWSGDFLASHPGAPSTYGTVNAVMPEIGVEASFREGLLAVDVGVSTWIPLGEHHTARTGTTELRVRPLPTLAVGVPWARAVFGFLFPHHPIVGLRGEVPLPGDLLAIRAEGRLGPSLTFSGSGTPWTSQPVRSVGVSLVVRRGLP